MKLPKPDIKIDPIKGITLQQIIDLCTYKAGVINEGAGLTWEDKTTAVHSAAQVVHEKIISGYWSGKVLREFEGYLFIVLRNALLQQWKRHNKPANQITDNALVLEYYQEYHTYNPFEEHEQIEEQAGKVRQLYNEIQKLKPAYREVLKLYLNKPSDQNFIDAGISKQILQQAKALLKKRVNRKTDKAVQAKKAIRNQQFEDKKNEVVSLYTKGNSIKKIASIMGETPKIISRYLKSAKVNALDNRKKLMADKAEFIRTEGAKLLAEGKLRKDICQILQCEKTTLRKYLGKHQHKKG